MRSHQQRVPIISPLDRDYRRSSYTADHLNFSNASLSSYQNPSSSPESIASSADTSNGQLFTIVGERESRD